MISTKIAVVPEVTEEDLVELIPIPKGGLPRPQPSMVVNENVMIAAADGERWACLIRDSWKPNLPVRKMSRSELEMKAAARNVTFCA